MSVDRRRLDTFASGAPRRRCRSKRPRPRRGETGGVRGVCLGLLGVGGPFLVALRGGRGGGGAEPTPAETASRYGLLRAYQRKSITEFEVLYGVLHNPAMRGHAFFYFRDP